MHNVFIAFGSNMGNRRRMIEYALILCSDLIGKVVALSEIRSSAPVGYDSDHEYLNGVFHLETRLEPDDTRKLAEFGYTDGDTVRIIQRGCGSC